MNNVIYNDNGKLSNIPKTEYNGNHINHIKVNGFKHIDIEKDVSIKSEIEQHEINKSISNSCQADESIESIKLTYNTLKSNNSKGSKDDKQLSGVNKNNNEILNQKEENINPVCTTKNDFKEEPKVEQYQNQTILLNDINDSVEVNVK